MSQSPTTQLIPAASFTAGTPFTLTAPQYYERIIITNEAASADLYVATNGTAAGTAAGTFGAVVLPGAWRMVGNDQPREPNNTPTAGTSPQQEGWTVQNKGFQGATTPNLNPMASGAPTFVSLLFPTGSTVGAVGVEFV